MFCRLALAPGRRLCYNRHHMRTNDFVTKTLPPDYNGDAKGEERRAMGKPPKYFIVEASALPEIFRKVAEAKRLLELGEAETVHQATEMVGISRSAFYKYKDAVRPFNDMLHGRIVTVQVRLRDEPGVLSSVLNSFAV